MDDFVNKLPVDEDPGDIYGGLRPEMARIMNSIRDDLESFREDMKNRSLDDPIDRIFSRIKDEDSMREKLESRGLPVTVRAALTEVEDAIGIRVVCPFVNDVYMVRDYLSGLRDPEVVSETDHIKEPCENGYRGLHLILKAEKRFFAEVQIRTVTMDIWANLENSMLYLHDIGANTDVIEKELKRCADDLASADESLQSIRDMIGQASC